MSRLFQSGTFRTNTEGLNRVTLPDPQFDVVAGEALEAEEAEITKDEATDAPEEGQEATEAPQEAGEAESESEDEVPVEALNKNQLLAILEEAGVVGYGPSDKKGVLVDAVQQLRAIQELYAEEAEALEEGDPALDL